MADGFLWLLGTSRQTLMQRLAAWRTERVQAALADRTVGGPYQHAAAAIGVGASVGRAAGPSDAGDKESCACATAARCRGPGGP
jgi:hypothetical protein